MAPPIAPERVRSVTDLLRAGLTTQEVADRLGISYSQANQARRKARLSGLVDAAGPGPRVGRKDSELPATVRAWMEHGFVARRAAQSLGISESGMKKRLVRAAELGLVPTDEVCASIGRARAARRKESQFHDTVKAMLANAQQASSGAIAIEAVMERQNAAIAALQSQVKDLVDAVAKMGSAPAPAPTEPTEPTGKRHGAVAPPGLVRRQLEVVVAALGPDRVREEVAGLSAGGIRLALAGKVVSTLDAAALDRLYVLVRAVDLDLDEADMDEVGRWFRRARRDRLDSLVGHQGVGA